MGIARRFSEKIGQTKVWRFFNNLKFAKKMIVVYMIFAVFFCAISMLALQINLDIYDEKLYEKSQQELDFFTQKVNERLKDVEQLSYEIALDNEIQDKLVQMNDCEYLSAAYCYELQGLRSMLTNKIISKADVKNVIYTDGNKVMMTVGTECGQIEDSTLQQLMGMFAQKHGGYTFLSPTEEYPYLLSGRDILKKKNATLDYLGTLIITTDIAGGIEKQTEELDAEHAMLFVYSESGMIYQEEEPENIPKLPELDQKSGYQIIRYEGERYFVCYQKSERNQWMYVNMFPYSEIFGQILFVRNMLLLGFVLISIAMLIAMRKMSNVITRPLEQLSESMQIVETGDFVGAKAVLLEEERNDEVGQLSTEFRVMLEQIDTLIHENYKKQLILQDTKYKMLQAQINPHFLYNTLNALNWMVKAGRNEDAGKMIMELGLLLRASFAKELYTTVEEEAQTAQSYITIQKFRYNKRAEFFVRTEGELSRYKMPRMILQPLIENAINYGVEQSLDICRIDVEVIEEENDIFLQVSDTGAGMIEEELEAVRNLAFVPKGHGVGLKNIRERLDATYENSQFQIESALGKGTVVTIRIPKEKESRQDVSLTDCR
ncbi:MAG: sensor histidine kinase [Oliverpabstia sp.]